MDTFTAKDVVLGKGNGVNILPGNVRFRELVNKHRQAYSDQPRTCKGIIAHQVIAEVKAAGGRFLKRRPDGKFDEASSIRAYEKTCQALREKRKTVATRRKNLMTFQTTNSESKVENKNGQRSGNNSADNVRSLIAAAKLATAKQRQQRKPRKPCTNSMMFDFLEKEPEREKLPPFLERLPFKKRRMESQTVSLSSPSSSSSSSSLLSSPRSAFAPIPDIVTTRSIQFAAPGNNKEARLENKNYSGLRNINNGGITAGLIPRVLTADSDSESSLTEVEEDYNNGDESLEAAHALLGLMQ